MKPCSFRAEQIAAVKEGRKTQCLRVIKPQPIAIGGGWYEWGSYYGSAKATSPQRITWHGETAQQGIGTAPIDRYCPYGQPGDLMWVRESWSPLSCPRHDESQPPGTECLCRKYIYRADGELPLVKWRPAVTMPQWVSRITLRITEVRAMRLRDISEEDAKRNGAAAWHDTVNGAVYKSELALMWDAVNGNGEYNWKSNPWVWLLGFEVKK